MFTGREFKLPQPCSIIPEFSPPDGTIRMSRGLLPPPPQSRLITPVWLLTGTEAGLSCGSYLEPLRPWVQSWQVRTHPTC